MRDELKPCPFCGVKPEKEAVYCGSAFYEHFCDHFRFSGISEVWNRLSIEDAQAARIAELEAERDRLREALERIKKLSYPDNVCNNCINSEELVSEDWCKLSGKELEDASSQTCEKFTPHIVPEIYVIAQEALKGEKQ